MTRKAYLDDPWTSEFTARIVGIGRDRGHPFALVEETWFFPESGGQRADRGTLGEHTVVDVREEGAEIRHVLDRPMSLETVGRQLPARIDRERRLDHMQHHTAQHLLSAAFVEVLKAPTVSFHMGDATCTIDLDREELTRDEADRVEDRANSILLEDRPVRILYPSTHELAAMVLRKDPVMLDHDRIRIVEIDGCDLSPCGGTHCERTGQIGAVHIRRWERVRQKVRVHFLAGSRALRDHRATDRITLSLSAALSAPRDELEESVRELVDRQKRVAKENEALHEELVVHRAAALLESARWIGALRLVAAPGGPEAASCKALATRLGREHDVVALVWSPAGDLVLACGSGTAVDAGRLLRDLLAIHQGKGGGRAEVAQGRIAPGSTGALVLDLTTRLTAHEGDLARLGRFTSEHVTKQGESYRVREALPADAPALTAYVRAMLDGRPMLRTELEDFTTTPEEMATRLATARQSETSIFLIAELGGALVGVIDFRGGDRKRIRHTGDFGLTVAEGFRGRGIGRALLQGLVEWCRRTGIVRKVNLVVFRENETARRLYASLGFVDEGRTSRQVAVDGRFVDEINMGLWIGTES